MINIRILKIFRNNRGRIGPIGKKTVNWLHKGL